MKDTFKDPMKPKHHPRHERQDRDDGIVKTLVGGVIALSLVKAITK